MVTELNIYVDESGLHYPSYKECKDYFVYHEKRIYGNDIYIDNDSMDGERIAIMTLATFQSFQAAEIAYNNTAPSMAIGTALARLVKLNGMTVKESGYSTVYLELRGKPFITIKNGIVSDTGGNKWNLPQSVNLGENGVVYVTATAQEKGSVTALPRQVNKIDTPQYGWSSVQNKAAASPGQATEKESQIRLRQKQTVALPSQALLEGVEAALWNLENVTDVKVAENDTDLAKVVDGFTLPSHSITCVVDGGSEEEIAKTIFYKKTPGCYTHGDIEKVVYDKYQNVNYIRFFRSEKVKTKTKIILKPLSGFSDDITAQIKNSIKEYINSLRISVDLIQSALNTIINESNEDMRNPIFSVLSLEIAKHDESFSTNDIIINLNQKITIDIEDIEVILQNGDS